VGTIDVEAKTKKRVGRYASQQHSLASRFDGTIPALLTRIKALPVRLNDYYDFVVELKR
jgi:hypothetical protein